MVRDNGIMPTMRLALAQVDPTVGDLAGNVALVRGCTRKAAESGAHLVAFPEMMLTGYPVEDLVFRESFVTASKAALRRSPPTSPRTDSATTTVVVGYLDADGPAADHADTPTARGPRNALAVLHGGRVHATYFKHHLPNYGVFDEDRYFVPGDTCWGVVIRLAASTSRSRSARTCGRRAARSRSRPGARVGLVVNINGSPYELNKDDVRLPWCGAGRPRPARSSPTSTWSAARTSSSSTATRWSSRPTGGARPCARSSPRS